MFRLVVIHQLVLALLVGPMLCCCTTARMGQDVNSTFRTTHTSDESQPKHCCEHGQKSPNGGRHVPCDDKSSDSASCLCQDGPINVLTVPEAATVSANSLLRLGYAIDTLGLPAVFEQRAIVVRLAFHFGFRSDSLWTAELLYVHHNLRC